MGSKLLDEIVLAKHRSGLAFTLSPDMNGKFCIWIDLKQTKHYNGVQRRVCRYESRQQFAAWSSLQLTSPPATPS